MIFREVQILLKKHREAIRIDSHDYGDRVEFRNREALRSAVEGIKDVPSLEGLAGQILLSPFFAEPALVF